MAPANPNIRNHDLLALRSYVQAHDSNQHATRTHATQDTIWLDVTHSNLNQRHQEIKFFVGDTLADLRARIHRQTGTNAASQHLQVYWNDSIVADFSPDSNDAQQQNNRTLGSLQFQTGMRVHCIDTNPYSLSSKGGLEDVSLVPKFKLTDHQYDTKKNTLRSWARSQKEQNPEFTLQKHAEDHGKWVDAKRLYQQGKPLPAGFEIVDNVVVATATDNTNNDTHNDDEFGLESTQHVTLGARCQVDPGQRRGVVAWMGQVNDDLGDQVNSNMPGYWVGVVFDEPVGRSDGTVQGRRYFETPGPLYGGMVRGRNITTGDFPERNCWEDSDEDDEL
jgi:tubulin-folding cofactor B